MKPIRCTALALVALAGFVHAGEASAQSVTIKHAVARVVVIPEDRRDVEVEIRAGRAELPVLRTVRTARGVEIDGGLRAERGMWGRSTIQQCNRGSQDARQPGEGANVSVRGYGQIDMQDAPLIVLRTPRRVELDAGNAVFGAIGPGAERLELTTAGCGRWTVADIAGKAEVTIGGSGDVRMGRVEDLEASIGGSGSILAREAKGLGASIGGSGSVRLGRISGPVDIAIGGSGGVRIDSGQASSMEVAVAGSGDVVFRGEAQSLEASIVGSGTVRVLEVRGDVKQTSMGSGRVILGK